MPKLSPIIGFDPPKCEHCNQSTQYLLAIDRGTVDIMRATSAAIGKKGINAIHPRKEMEVPAIELKKNPAIIYEGHLTSNQVGNLTRARAHGFIARIKDHAGNYCLTTKGSKFLHNEEVPRAAIMDKTTKHQVGYFKPEIYTCKITDFIKNDDNYWQGINYEIKEGVVVYEPITKTKVDQLSLAI